MKFSVLFAVGANCVRPRAFTERPYEFDFLSAGNPALWKTPLLRCFLYQFDNFLIFSIIASK